RRGGRARVPLPMRAESTAGTSKRWFHPVAPEIRGCALPVWHRRGIPRVLDHQLVRPTHLHGPSLTPDHRHFLAASPPRDEYHCAQLFESQSHRPRPWSAIPSVAHSSLTTSP